MIPQVLAVINGKGGTLKTTIASNLAALLVLFGYVRVLVISLDPQGDLLRDFGLRGTAADDGGQRLAAALTGAAVLEPYATGRPGLDILAGGDDLDDLAVDIDDLYTALAPVAEQWDLIVLDCPPGNKSLQRAAMRCARWVLIPTKPDGSSLEDGVGKVADLFAEARGDAKWPGFNPYVELIGVVLADIGVMSRAIRARVQKRIDKMFPGSTGILLASSIRHAQAPAVDARDLGLLTHEMTREVYDGPEAKALGLRYPSSASGVAGDQERLAREVVDVLAAKLAAAEAAELAEVGAS